ncbi:MAG: hypothetical protein K2P17_04020 [Helicobacteraceae bacterium]|nr:hypothetical protein [Helicobacteraceae bacterium]
METDFRNQISQRRRPFYIQKLLEIAKTAPTAIIATTATNNEEKHYETLQIIKSR